MENRDPREVGEAKLKFTAGLDKLRYARDRLAMQKDKHGPRRAGELQSVILGIEAILEVL